MNEKIDWAALYARGRAATEQRHRRQMDALYTMGGCALGVSLLIAMFLDTALPRLPMAAGWLLFGLIMLAAGWRGRQRGRPGNPVVLRARVQRKHQLSRFWLLELAIAEAVRVQATGTAERDPHARAWPQVPVDKAIGRAVSPDDEIWLLCTPQGYGVELVAPPSLPAVVQASPPSGPGQNR